MQTGGRASDTLLEVDLTIFPSRRCDESYRNLPVYESRWPEGLTDENTLCVGDARARGNDACGVINCSLS